MKKIVIFLLSIGFLSSFNNTVYAQTNLAPNVKENSKKFSNLSDFVLAIEKLFQNDLDEIKKAKAEIQKASKTKIENFDAAEKKKLLEGQAQLAALLKDPKIEQQYKNHQLKQLTKIKIGANKADIIAQFKTADDDITDPTKFNSMFVVRPAFSDVALVNQERGGMIDLPIHFVFTNDGKLRKVYADTILVDNLVAQTWYVE